MRKKKPILLLIPILLLSFARPEKEFKVYQFPKHRIPRIDGDFSDWEIVPDSFSIGLDELMDTEDGHGMNLDPKDYNIKVKVGWVKDMNSLFFYIEAWDDYWDFDASDLKQDIFELVVDANLSGGPFIKHKNGNLNKLSKTDLHFKGHGEHAQNYHIFTPSRNKEWAMIWGNQHWIKDFPYSNSICVYDFEHGENGILKMEFRITPFDHASPDGYACSKVSKLEENSLIGLSWCIIDYDGGEKREAFMNLAHDTEMIRNASCLCAFRLMPLSEKFNPAIRAAWEFKEIDRNQKWIQFLDKSEGKIDSWYWDFGDGTFSTEQNPAHVYDQAGEWTVILEVKGPQGTDTLSKVWDVVTK